MSATGSAPAIIEIPITLWRRLILDLRQKSAGMRESGAFVLGRRRGSFSRVTEYLCYDALDPEAYQGGAIAFHAPGYAALWKHCRHKELEVLADVHTHPSGRVRQSPIDRENPMVPVFGHTAIIVPDFGRTAWWSLKAAGVYEYLGGFQWRDHPTSKKSSRVRLVLW